MWLCATCSRWSCSGSRGWTVWPPEVPSSPDHSVIPWGRKALNVRICARGLRKSCFPASNVLSCGGSRSPLETQGMLSSVLPSRSQTNLEVPYLQLMFLSLPPVLEKTRPSTMVPLHPTATRRTQRVQEKNQSKILPKSRATVLRGSLALSAWRRLIKGCRFVLRGSGGAAPSSALCD